MVPSPGRNAGKQEVEADLQLSYITDKNNSLLDEISELLHELDSISAPFLAKINMHQLEFLTRVRKLDTMVSGMYVCSPLLFEYI